MKTKKIKGWVKSDCKKQDDRNGRKNYLIGVVVKPEKRKK